jgi:hypothetical protein
MIVVVPYAEEILMGECRESLQKQTDSDFIWIEGPDPDRALGALQNIVRCIKMIPGETPGETPIIWLDGDDALYPEAVANIRDVYARHPDLWVSFGDFTCEEKPSKTRNRLFRWKGSIRDQWRFMGPPRVFRYKLWTELIRRDPELSCMRFPNGKWTMAAADIGLFFPLIEMAGQERCRYLRKKNAIYRWDAVHRHEGYRASSKKASAYFRGQEPWEKIP